MKKSVTADLCLLAITLIWGATFPLISLSLKYINPFVFVSIRFSMATLILLLAVFKNLKRTTSTLIWGGFVLGMLNAFVYGLQTFGMQHVDTDTSAFIASIGVVIVPFISPLFKLHRVSKLEIVAAFICLIGLYVLTGSSLKSLNIGEGWIAISSLCWALSVCYLQKITSEIRDYSLLVFYQLLFTIPLPALLAINSNSINVFHPTVMAALLYCSILATVFVFLVQARFQKDTTASHAAIIYSLEPVFATVFATFIAGESITRNIYFGGGLIIVSVLMIELLPNLMRISRITE